MHLLTILVLLLIPIRPAAGPDSFGDEGPAFLGVQFSVPNLVGDSGVEVGKIIAETAAERSGLLPGDRILSVDGAPTDHPETLIELITACRPGEAVTLKILREEKPQEVLVTLGRRPTHNPDLVQEDPPRVDGGTFETRGVVSTGGFANATNLVLSSGGRLEVNGDAEFRWTGVVDLNLHAREGHSSVVSTGKAIMAGILHVGLEDSLEPVSGDAFELVAAGEGLEGRFGKVLLPDLPEGLEWELVYDDLAAGVDLDADGRHDVTLLVRGRTLTAAAHPQDDPVQSSR